MEALFTMDFSELADMITEKVTENLRSIIRNEMNGGTGKSINSHLKKGHIRGNKGLARELGVDPGTIHKWRKSGIIQDAIVAEYGRVIIYDIEKVMTCLQHSKVKAGRPKINNR